MQRCGPGNKGSELSNTLNVIYTLVFDASIAFMYVMSLFVIYLWPCVVFVSPRGCIDTYRKDIAPKLLCLISIRLHRVAPHFGNNESFKLLHLNVRSLFKKLDQLQVAFSQATIDNYTVQDLAKYYTSHSQYPT